MRLRVNEEIGLPMIGKRVHSSSVVSKQKCLELVSKEERQTYESNDGTAVETSQHVARFSQDMWEVRHPCMKFLPNDRFQLFVEHLHIQEALVPPLLE